MAKQNKKLAQVFHFDLYGKREEKYDFLNENSIKSIPWNELEPNEPNYFLINKNFEGRGKYEKGFKLDELFTLNASGIKTQRDDASIKISEKECKEIKEDFLNLSNQDLVSKYGFKDVRDWTIDFAKTDLKKNAIIANKILYRPFDFRFMNYTGKTKGVMGYPRLDVMKHLLKRNIAILTCRQQSTFDFQHIIVSNYIADMCAVSLQTKETGYVLPLYLYPETTAQQTTYQTTERAPNLNPDIVKQIADKLNLTFTNEKEPSTDALQCVSTFAPIDILDYIYAVLHSPTYREKYKEFLKIDFPRVPYPKDKDTFWQLVKLGGEIRQIHLLESPIVEKYITQYSMDGDNVVAKPLFDSTQCATAFGNVYINETQYFANVPEIAWNFYIGGYQPAQKWLKDRKGRVLGFEDILHYQKIIVALSETDRLMKEIDKIEVE